MTATHYAAPCRATRAPMDAIALLEADHEAVSQLFDEYDRTRSISSKKMLVAEICTALAVHMQIEAEIFYPAVKSALKGKLPVPEAKVEHAGVLGLISQLMDAEHDGKMYDAKVKVLSEYVKHHVMEEHTEMFPMVNESSLDLFELGARLTARKDDLLARAARNKGIPS